MLRLRAGTSMTTAMAAAMLTAILGGVKLRMQAWMVVILVTALVMMTDLVAALA